MLLLCVVLFLFSVHLFPLPSYNRNLLLIWPQEMFLLAQIYIYLIFMRLFISALFPLFLFGIIILLIRPNQ